MIVKIDDGYLYVIYNWIFLEWFFFICLIILLKGILGKVGLWNFDNFFFVFWNVNCKKIMKNIWSIVLFKRKYEIDKWNVVLFFLLIFWINDVDSFFFYVCFEVVVIFVCIWCFEIFGYIFVEGNCNFLEMFFKIFGKVWEVAIGW